MTALEIGDLDAAGDGEVIAALAPLFEGAPRFLARLAAARPFGDWSTLFERARTLARAMPEEEQIELIDAHPRLGAPPGTVSALSFREQGYQRPADLRDPADPRDPRAPGDSVDPGAEVDVEAELARLNSAYEARFGFRYCVFVAGRPRGALLPGMAAALEADREGELRRALDAVVDIAVARLEALRELAT